MTEAVIGDTGRAIVDGANSPTGSPTESPRRNVRLV